MHELHAILDMWQQVKSAANDAVLATVVHVTGSAYRRPGARMLVASEGRRIGTVSGGCLEGELTRKAWWFTKSGTPVVRTYDTTSDDDAIWEFGLGCNGVVHVMLERTSHPGTSELLEILTQHRHLGTAMVAATVIAAGAHADVRIGDRLLVDDTGVIGGALVGSQIEELVRCHAAGVLGTTTSCLVHLDDVDVFVEWIGPPLPLVIFGCGDDAVPLSVIAKQLGWYVTVADGRPAYATAERFPSADRVVALRTGDLLENVHIDERTAVVMMTHNYPLDSRLLPLVLGRRPRYLGLLGPRSRTAKLFGELGLDVPQHVNAPVGLDVGGDTPAAAALSIAAEIQAIVNGRAGGMLNARNASIHPPVVEVGAQTVRVADAPARPAYCETMVGSHV